MIPVLRVWRELLEASAWAWIGGGSAGGVEARTTGGGAESSGAMALFPRFFSSVADTSTMSCENSSCFSSAGVVDIRGLYDVRLHYLFDTVCRGAARVEVRWWTPHEDGASLCGGRSGGGLRGQPGVDTSLESLSWAVEGDRLAVREMHSVHRRYWRGRTRGIHLRRGTG